MNIQLEMAFNTHCKDATHFTRRMAVNIADDCMMGVHEAISALTGAGKVKAGTWEWFQQNGGITKEHIAKIRDDRSRPITLPTKKGE